MLGLRRATFSVSAVLVLAAGIGSVGGCDAAKAPAVDNRKAAANGKLKPMREQLKAGADINGTFVEAGTPNSGGTWLHVAILADRVKAAKLLIKGRADLNAKADDEHRGTPLHWAPFVGGAFTVAASKPPDALWCHVTCRSYGIAAWPSRRLTVPPSPAAVVWWLLEDGMGLRVPRGR